jgi:hypothetical protein
MQNFKLTIDLLPKGAWGNDFSITLPKKQWDALRKTCYELAGNKCEICGKETPNLAAHEVWTFDVDNKTQTLKEIVALCPACHGVKHFRNSTRIGYGEQSKAHFMKINNCDFNAFMEHYLEAQATFDELSKIKKWEIIAPLLDELEIEY